MIGLTVLPEYIQSEGVETLLDHLQSHAPITAIATSPYVMVESDAERGQREPPADAGSGAKRLLDRPLWGKREIWVETAPSFSPSFEHYRNTSYQPAPANELTQQTGGIVAEFITAAKQRGIEVLLQIQAAIPPGYRVQFGGPLDVDRPMLPDGSFPQRRLALNGTLASDDILSYGEGLIRDLLEQYPDAAGVRIDWPEYPPYFFDDLFLDFNPQTRPFAEELGIDLDQLAAKVAAIRSGLLKADAIADLAHQMEHLSKQLQDLLRLKGSLVTNLMRRYRSVVGSERKLIPGIFPDPWNQFAGSAPANLVDHSDAIFCKLYTMHWPMIVDHYRGQLLDANPDWNSDELTRVLVELLGIDEFRNDADFYNYPDPETAHPVSSSLQAEKIRLATRESGEVPLVPMAHSYGPLEDFRQRLETAWSASTHGVWINRYGYVSDAKLRAIGEVCR